MADGNPESVGFSSTMSHQAISHREFSLRNADQALSFVKLRPAALSGEPGGLKVKAPPEASRFTLPVRGGPSCWPRTRTPSWKPAWPWMVWVRPASVTAQEKSPSLVRDSVITTLSEGFAVQVPTRLAGGFGGAWAGEPDAAGWPAPAADGAA